MLARDHTALLHRLFEQGCLQSSSTLPVPSQSHPAERHATTTTPTTAAPFVKALGTITKGFEQLRQDADCVVRSALLTMDDVVVGTTADMEAQVRDAIASGISLGATVAQFIEAIDKAAEVEAKVAADLDAADEADAVDGQTASSLPWGDRLLQSVRAASAAAEHMLLALPSKLRSTRRSASCMQTLAHCRAAGETLQARIVAIKLRLALCEEELERYQKDLFVMGRCNVLSGCATTRITDRSAWSSSSAAAILRRKEDAAVLALDDDAADEQRASLGARKLNRGKAAAKRVVASVSSMTATVGAKVAAAAAASKVAARSHMRGGTDVSTVHPSGEPATPDGHLRPSHPQALYRPAHTFTFTDDDRATLAQESIALEQQLVETSARAAKEIESSIRELSHLTSILNEQAVLQTEQLTYVAKNTEEAFQNVSKASRELKQPRKSSFWQPTRQLIALLWMCIVAMLFAHMLVR